MANFEKIRQLREDLERREDERTEAGLNTPEGEIRRQERNEETRRKLRNQRRRAARQATRQAYESCGLKRVRGSQGGTYWE